ncbi:MAG: hypothetical protein EWV91_01920 [Microcystis aeruginosa Ma_QC_Ca_00000000_S207]|uniref:Uncharacterized protein n=1 Tax=Microcystis aeruginosa Ma_QC_Ca_00000000_S207 TaxID=2486251 RepID=A0A552G310_MICAE|nr:MAG: hypothetical protein EWV91_01920 [Microcystis aeruginosa Ma_QC_Ca_00000000_S207]TRU62618.1 MAG: hypothetical protein EWV56_06770 [Microcystis aeruginosa Ma_QC_C_20070823_S13D]TRU65488.1 MAG: hypothetical protein EWV48_04375 [Microcystis aeruginosa Ma_QC_C_20070823_S13]
MAASQITNRRCSRYFYQWDCSETNYRNLDIDVRTVGFFSLGVSHICRNTDNQQLSVTFKLLQIYHTKSVEYRLVMRRGTHARGTHAKGKINNQFLITRFSISSCL